MVAEEQVVLVNEANEVLGYMPKLEAHEKGVLHRAISVIIYNDKGEMLLQQRAAEKYHWPQIWSNACCTHPRKEESFAAAAARRLQEELGFTTALKEVHRFVYQATDADTGLIEHEFDCVFEGVYNGDIPFNTDEVMAVKWITIPELQQAIEANPEQFSFWFKEIISQLQIK